MTKKYDRKKYLDKSIGMIATPKDIKRGFSLYRRQNASQTTVKGRSSIKKTSDNMNILQVVPSRNRKIHNEMKYHKTASSAKLQMKLEMSE